MHWFNADLAMRDRGAWACLARQHQGSTWVGWGHPNSCAKVIIFSFFLFHSTDACSIVKPKLLDRWRGVRWMLLLTSLGHDPRQELAREQLKQRLVVFYTLYKCVEKKRLRLRIVFNICMLSACMFGTSWSIWYFGIYSGTCHSSAYPSMISLYYDLYLFFSPPKLASIDQIVDTYVNKVCKKTWILQVC